MKNFARGVVIGGVLGATASLILNTDVMSTRTRRRMMRSGKELVRRSSRIIGNMVTR
jgi:gas vesicle protein